MNTDRDKEEVLMQAEIYVENGFIDRRTYRQTNRQTQRYRQRNIGTNIKRERDRQIDRQKGEVWLRKMVLPVDDNNLTAELDYGSVSFVVPLSALIVLNVVVIIGNCLVITAVFTHTKLRSTQTNRFIVSLAAADLLVGILVLPFSSANEVRFSHHQRLPGFH